MRQILKDGQGENGIRVNLRGGNYNLDQPITFGRDDSGKGPNSPVVWKAYEGNHEQILSIAE